MRLVRFACGFGIGWLRNTDTYADADGYTDTHADAYAYTDNNIDTDGYANIHADTNCDPAADKCPGG